MKVLDNLTSSKTHTIQLKKLCNSKEGSINMRVNSTVDVILNICSSEIKVVTTNHLKQLFN